MKCFYLVWNPNGHAPTRQHETRESAQREAERLAANNGNGDRFYVLETVSVSARQCSPVRTEMIGVERSRFPQWTREWGWI